MIIVLWVCQPVCCRSLLYAFVRARPVLLDDVRVACPSRSLLLPRNVSVWSGLSGGWREVLNS